MVHGVYWRGTCQEADAGVLQNERLVTAGLLRATNLYWSLFSFSAYWSKPGQLRTAANNSAEASSI